MQKSSHPPGLQFLQSTYRRPALQTQGEAVFPGQETTYHKHVYYFRHCPSSWVLFKDNILENGSVSVITWKRGMLSTQLDFFERTSLDHLKSKEILSRMHIILLLSNIISRRQKRRKQIKVMKGTVGKRNWNCPIGGAKIKLPDDRNKSSFDNAEF